MRQLRLVELECSRRHLRSSGVYRRRPWSRRQVDSSLGGGLRQLWQHVIRERYQGGGRGSPAATGGSADGQLECLMTSPLPTT